jgi:hypothetical protein
VFCVVPILALDEVRSGAHHGLKSNISQSPKCAKLGRDAITLSYCIYNRISISS